MIHQDNSPTLPTGKRPAWLTRWLSTDSTSILRPGSSKRTLHFAERIGAKEAAAILGVKPRKLQAMSARGAIPGAARIGRQWSFDPAKLRRYLKNREREVCQEAQGAKRMLLARQGPLGPR